MKRMPVFGVKWSGVEGGAEGLLSPRSYFCSGDVSACRGMTWLVEWRL